MAAKTKNHQAIMSMFIIGVLFFVFGFVTWLNGSLIPLLQIVCDLNEFQALFVTFAFYIAYTVMALPMSFILSKTGYRNGMMLGLFIMFVGALLHIPAALTANYGVFLVALFVLASGLTVLQTAANPYLVKIGPAESAAIRISIMGIVNKLAGVVVPIVFAALILSGMGDISREYLAGISEAELVELRVTLSSELIYPYLWMSIVLLALVLLIKFMPLPNISINDEADGLSSGSNHKNSVWSFPQAILGSIALFSYVGVEVIAADTIGLYGAELGVPNFASLTSYTMGFMVLGYSIGIVLIPKFVTQVTALRSSAIAGIFCVVGIFISNDESSQITSVVWGWSGLPLLPDPVFFVALMGFAHALVFPTIWPLALDGLGRYSSQASALLIMGISGGAILPLIFGKIHVLSENIQLAYLIGIPCYSLILYYALSGHKLRSWDEFGFRK